MILPSQSRREEDEMEKTSPDILAFVALIGALMFWMV
jgi:hypothetical protein